MVKKVISRCALPTGGLAIFRRGLGLLCVIDCLLRFPGHKLWLTDLGLLPRSLYFRVFEDSLLWSLYSVSGRPEFSLTLLLLTAVLGSLQLFGRSTTLQRVALWLLMLSVQHRNPVVVDSGDDLLRLMLFWDMLLPQEREPGTNRSGFAVLGLQLQLTLGLLGTAWVCLTRWPQSAMWSLGERALWTPWFGIASGVCLVVLALAIWLRSIRRPVLLVAAPVLVWWAVILHPWLPMVLAVCASTLYGKSDRETEFVSPRSKWTTTAYCIAYLLAILQMLPAVGEAARKAAESVGLQQSWTRFYPLSENFVGEFSANVPGLSTPLWVINARSDRRARLWAQSAAEDDTLTNRLQDALKHNFATGDAGLAVIKKTIQLPEGSIRSVKVDVLMDDPAHYPAMLILGESMAGQGRLEDARALYSALIEQLGPRHEVTVEAGRRLEALP